ncbi:MAG: elongation factor P [Proteobacteria bacterium]|nr:elongation factor P [Pseudomonadota bacterium]
MKVNANTLRAGHVVEMNGQLYSVLKAENIQPGKGTPVTQVDMRRLGDGNKVTERFRTQEQVERAYIDEREFQYLYREDENHAFMDIETFDQLSVSAELIGDPAQFLQDGMHVSIRLHEGKPVSVELPQKVILEVTETEPTVKGQTAASSYKPAVLSNGIRSMVPSFITPGTKIVVNTADGSYLERAKD